MQKNIRFVITAVCIILTTTVKSQTDNAIKQDSLHLTLESAERMFLNKNLLLLAQHSNIDAQKALIIQAKLFPNPNLNFSTTLYQPITKKLLPVGQDGEISGGISQVILLASKHNKEVKLAETNAMLSEFQYYDLLRTLKHTLNSDFFNIHYLLQSSKAYDTEISTLQKVTDAFSQQQGKGYISEKEALRIKAQLYSLQSEYNDLKGQIYTLQSELRLLLQINNVFVVPDIDSITIANLNPSKYPLSVMIDSAYTLRPDLQIAKTNVDISTLNYKLQKSMSVPDLTLQVGYDQQGSYINNLTTLGLGVDIPILNRNQGNIKSAKALIDYNKETLESVKESVKEQVYLALQKAFDNRNLLKSRDPLFEKNFNRLQNEVLKNYQVRNITLLDFLDFYDSYKQNMLQINSISFNYINAFEDLSFYTGINFFNK